MATLLIIALVFGMMCVAAWKNPRYYYPSNTIMGKLERIPGYRCSWLFQETSRDVALSDNKPIDLSDLSCARELPPIQADFSGWEITITWEQTANDDQ